MRLVRWLLANGIEVRELKHGYRYTPPGGTKVRFEQALVGGLRWTSRSAGLAYTALGAGQDISAKIAILYAPPGAWSHGFLWGADVLEIPDGAKFNPEDEAGPEGQERARWRRRKAGTLRRSRSRSTRRPRFGR